MSCSEDPSKLTRDLRLNEERYIYCSTVVGQKLSRQDIAQHTPSATCTRGNKPHQL